MIVLYSLIAVIFHENIHHLQKLMETRLYFTRNDGFQTILYSLITVILHEYMQHLQKIMDTRLCLYCLIAVI